MRFLKRSFNALKQRMKQRKGSTALPKRDPLRARFFHSMELLEDRTLPSISLPTYIQDLLDSHSASFQVTEPLISSAALGDFLELDNLTLSADATLADGDWSGSITLSADTAVLFPGTSFSASITSITGTFTIGAGFEFTIADLQLNLGEALTITSEDTDITYNPSGDATQTLATIANATVTSGQFANMPTATLDNFVLRADGFSFDSFQLASAVGQAPSIGGFLATDKVTLTASDFDVEFGASPTLSGTVGIAIEGLALFPEGEFVELTSSAVNAKYDFADFNGTDPTGQLTVTVSDLKFTLGEALALAAEGDIVITPGAATIATMSKATLSSPMFASLGTVEVDDLVVTQTGFSLGTITWGSGGPVSIGGDILTMQSVAVTVSNFALDYASPALDSTTWAAGSNIVLSHMPSNPSGVVITSTPSGGSTTLLKLGTDFNLVPQGSTLKVVFTGHTPAIGDAIDVAYGFPLIGGAVSFAATGVALFPNIPVLNLSLGSLTGDFDFGNVAAPGELELHISDLSIPLGDAFTLTFGDIDLRPGAATMFHAVNVGVVTSLFTGFAPFTLPSLDITQTGFELGDFTLPTADIALGSFLSITGASLAVNGFKIDKLASPKVSGSVDLTIGSLTLFPGNPAVTSTITGVTGSFDFANLGGFTIHVDDFSLSLFSQITLAASDITFAPAQDTIATIGTASITFAPLNSLQLDVTDMAIRKDGFSIGSASFNNLPDLTLGGVLSLTGLSASLTDFDYTRVQQDASEDTTWSGTPIVLQNKPATLAGVVITSTVGTDDPVTLVKGVDYNLVTAAGVTTVQFINTPANGTLINVAYSYFGADTLKGIVSLGAGTSSLSLGGALNVSIDSVTADYDLATKALSATLDTFDLDIAGFANLHIDSAALAYVPASDKSTKMLLGATGVTAFFGVSGTNPIGVTLSDGELALAVYKSAANVTTYALEATGEVSLTGLPANTLTFTSGLTTFRKSTAGAVHEVIELDDVPANDLHLDFAGNETSAMGSGLSLSIGSFLSLSADFAFELITDSTTSTTYVLVGATNVDATLAAGDVSLTVDDASIGLLLQQGAGAAKGGYALVVNGGHDSLNGIPGFTLESDGLTVRVRSKLDANAITSGTIPSSIDTPSGTVSFDFSDLGSGTTDITDVQGHVKIAVDGLASIEGDFGFQKYVTADNKVTLAIGAKGVNVVMGTDTANVTVSDATLGFITQDGKFAMMATGDAKLNGVTGLTLTATDVLVRVRKGLDPDAFGALPTIQTSAGPVTLDFTGLGDSDVADIEGHVTLALDGIGSIEGDFGFQSYQDGVTGAKQLAIGATNLTAIVGTSDVNVTVANASFGLVVRPGVGMGASTYALIVRGSDTPSDTSLNGIGEGDSKVTLEASGLLVRVRKGLDLSASSAFPNVIHTSGGDVIPDFSGLGAGSTDVVDVQGAVKLSVANFVTIEGEFGFQQYTSGKDQYYAIGVHGSVTAGAGTNSISLNNAGVAVLVKKPFGAPVQYALQATGSDNPDDMDFVGPAGLSMSAANLVVRIRRGLDLSSYPAGVPASILLPSAPQDTTDPDIVISSTTGNILLGNTGINRDTIVVSSSTDGTNFTTVNASDYTLTVDPSGHVTLAFKSGSVPANGTTVRISYSYRPQPTTLTTTESLDSEWSTEPTASLEFLPANPSQIKVTSTVGGTTALRIAGTDYTLGTDSSGHTTITFLPGHEPDDGTSVSVNYGYLFPQPLTLDFGGLGAGTADITDIQGHVTIAMDGFASLEGDFGIQIYTPLVGTPVFLIGGTNIESVLGTSDVNVAISGASLGVMVRDGNYALVATGGSIALNGVPDLTLSAGDLMVKVRSGLTPSSVAGFPTTVHTPGGDVGIDFSGLPAGDVTAIQGHVTVDVAGFVSLEGDFSFTMATSGTAPNKTTKILVGASKVDAFIGAADQSVGVRLSDADLALAIYSTQGVPGSKYALQASSGIEIVGLPADVELSGTATVAINKTGSTAVNSESIPNAPAFNFTSGNVQSFGGHLTFAVGSDFSLEGDFSVTKAVSGNITKTLIGAANITTSAGSDVAATGGSDTFTLSGGKLGVVLYRDTVTNTSLGYALSASASATATVGTISAGATLNIRRNTTTTAQTDTVTAGGVTIPIAFTAAEVFKAGKAFQSISLSDVSLNFDDSIIIQAGTGSKNNPAVGAESTILTGVSVRLQDPTTEEELFTISADGAVYTTYSGTVTAGAALAGGVTAIGTTTLVRGANFDYTLNASAGSVTVNFNSGKIPTQNTKLRVAYELTANPGVIQYMNVVAGSSQASIVVNVAGIDPASIIVTTTPATALDWHNLDKSLYLTGITFTLGSYISFHADAVDIQHYTVGAITTNVFLFTGANIAFLNDGTPMAALTGNAKFTYTTGPGGGFTMNSWSLTDFSFLGQTAEIAAGTSPPPASPPGSPPPPPPPPPPPGVPPAPSSVRTLGPLSLDTPAVALTGFSFDPSGKLGAVVTISAKTATVKVGTLATATFTTLAGTFEIGAQFDLSNPLSAPTDPYAEFKSITAASLEVKLGQYVTLTANGVTVKPEAGPDEDLIAFTSINAALDVGSVHVTGSASKFAIQGDGDFVAKDGFSLGVTVSDATSLGVPSFVPLSSLSVTLQWPNFNAHPDQFLIQMSAAIGDIGGLGLTVNGQITNVVIDPALIAAGEFPIISIDSAAVSVSGGLVGGQVSGTLIFGVVRFDANGNVVDGLGNLQGKTTPGVAPFTSAFYTGLAGSIDIGGTLSFAIRVGISQFGLMQIYVEAGVPVPLGPTGLFLSDFRGGIQFGTTFPDLNISNPPVANDALKLRQPAFNTPDKLTAAQWEAQLRATLAKQYKANPGGGFSAPVGPFIIQAGATIYAANKNAFRVDGDLFIDSEGKILILGTGVFGDNLSVGVKLYTDLSDVFAGTSNSADVLFLMETPAQPNDLHLDPTYTLYGVLTISDLPGAFQISLAGGAQFNLMNLLQAKVEATITLTFTADSFNISLTSGQFTIPAIQADPLASAAGTLTIKTAADGSVGMWGGFLLVPNGQFLIPFGIDIGGQLFVKMNTTGQLKTVTVNLGSGQTKDLTLAPQSFSLLLTGHADFKISGTPVFRVDGTLAIDITKEHLALFVSASLMVGPDLNDPMLTFNANGLVYVQLVSAGDLSPGFAVKLTLSTGVSVPGVAFNTNWVLVANTTQGDVTFTIPTPIPTTPPSPPIAIVMGPDYSSTNPLALTSYEVTGSLGERQLIIPQGAPADGLSNYKTWSSASANSYFIVLGRGNVTISNTITMVGNMNIRGTISGGAVSFTMQMDATLAVKVGGNTVFQYSVGGGVKIGNDGIAAALAVNYSVGFTIPSNLGFKLNAGYVLELNTTGSPQSFSVPNFGTIAIPADQLVLIHGYGHLTMLGSVLDFYGSFDITIKTTSLSLAVNADITFLSATFHASGFAGIYYDSNPGLAMRMQLSLPGGAQGIAPISSLGSNFVISGAFSLELNTSSATRKDQNNQNIAPGFKVQVQNLGVYIYGFNASGSISVAISNAGFDFDVNVTLSLFGLASLNVTGYYHHDGTFLFTASAGFQFGDHIFGIGGTVSLTIGNNVFKFSVSGWAAAFGIEIKAGGGIDITGTSVDITIEFQVTIVPAVNIDTPDWHTFLGTVPGIHIHTPAVIVGKDATYHLGTTAPPPIVAQVVDAKPPPTPPHLAGFTAANGPNALVLFLGQDVGNRVNDDAPPILTPAQPAENYVLTHVAGDAGSTTGQTILVSALNFQQVFTNVTSIVVSNTLGGNDTITIDSGITVPSSFTLGSGNNVINAGGGVATIVVSGPGNNQIVAGNNATITVQSGATGNNQISAGTGSNITISAMGGTGVNQITAGASATITLAGTAKNQANLSGGGATGVTISGTGKNTVSVTGGTPTITITNTATNTNSVLINSSSASTVNVNGSGNNTVSSLGSGTSNITISANGSNQITTGGTAGGAASSVNLIGNGNNVVSTGAGPVDVFDRGTGANTISGGTGGGTLYYGTTAANGTGPAYTTKGVSSLTSTSGNFGLIARGYSAYQLSDYGLVADAFNLLLSGVKQATLYGATAPNTFTLLGYSGNATLNGVAGSDTMNIVPSFAAVGVDFLLTDSSLKLGTTQTITLNSIETANLVGASTGNNTFNITGWTGNGSLLGLANTQNTVTAVNDLALFTLSDTLLTRSGRGDMALAGIQNANLTGGAGQNTFTVGNWSGTANLLGLDNSDTYNLTLTGSGTGTFNVTDTGATGTDTLNVTASGTTQVTATSVRVGTQRANYGSNGIEVLNVFGGASGLTYNVQSTNAGISTSTIQTLGNLNTINVSSTAGNTPASAGNLNAIQGKLAVNVGSGVNNLLRISDLAGTAAKTATLTNGSITGFAPAQITYSATTGNFTNTSGAVDGIRLEGANLATLVIDILSTLLGSTTKVIGGSQNDVFNVGTAGQSLGQILGQLSVDGLGNNATPTTTLDATSIPAAISASHTRPVGDTLNFNDQGDAGSFTYQLSASAMTRGSLPQSLYGNFETVNLNAALGAATINVSNTVAGSNTTVAGSLNATPTGDTFNITTTGTDGNTTFVAGTGDSTFNLQSTGANGFTRIIGKGGNDSVFVSSNAIAGTRGNTDSILGTLSIDAGAGANNQLTIDDDTSANLNSNVKIDSDAITGLAPADIYYSATGGNFVNGDAGILIHGTDATVNAFDIRTTLQGSTITVEGGSLNDVFNVGDVVNSLAQILGRLTLDGRGNDASPTTTLNAASAAAGINASNTRPVGDTVNFNDHGDAGGYQYTLTSNTLDRSTLPQSSPDIAYGSLETVNLNTALGASTIDVLSTFAGSNTTVTGSLNATPTGDTFNITSTGANGNAMFIAGTGDTTFNLQSTGAGSFNRILGLGGNDTVRVSSNAIAGTHGNTEAILGTLAIDTGAGSMNRLIVDDFTGATTGNVTVHLDAITGLAPADIYYGATGGNFTNPGLANGVQIFGSDAGNNVFNVRSTLGLSTTQIDGGGANDRFNVSSDAGTNLGTLAGIRGDLTLKGGTGVGNRLIVSDFGNTDAAAARSNVIQTETTIGGTRYIQLRNFAGDIAGGIGGTVINYIAAGGFNNGTLEDGISLFGSDTLSSTFNVRTTLGGSTTKITTGSAADYFLVSSNANTNGNPDLAVPNGTLNGIAGNLTIEAGSNAANRLVVSDKAQTATPKSNVIQDAATIGGTSFQQVRNFAAGNLNYIATGGGFNHGSLEDGIRLDASSTLSSTFNVRTTLGGSTTKITTGSAADYFLVSSNANTNGNPGTNPLPNGTLNGIAGNLTIEAAGASNRLIISDIGQNTTPKTNVIQTTATIGGTTFQQLQNFAGNGNGPKINYIATGGGFNHTAGSADFADGIHLAGSQSKSTTFTFRTSLGGSTLLVDGGLANDNFFVGSPPPNSLLANNPADSGNLDLVHGQIVVVGNGGSDALVVNDAANGHTANASHAFNYTVTPNQVANDPTPVKTVPNVTIPPVRTFATNGVIYNASSNTAQNTVTTLRVDGTDDVNIFSVTPSTIATYTIDGNLPGSGVPIPGGGDYLKLDTTHFADKIGGRKLHIASVGNGFWTFASSPATKPVNFTSFERFNHVDVTAAVETLPNQSPVITVRDSETGEIKFQVAPYPGVTGTASVAVGDLNYDGIPDLAVAPGSNLPAVIRLFNGTPDVNANYPHAPLATFPAFAAAFRTGISLGIGDLNADGANELVVGAGSGSGGGYQPTVQVFNGQTILTGLPSAAPPQLAGAPFLAFEPSFTGGVNVSIGDLDNDGREDILTTRQSGTATVNVFSYTGSAFPLRRSFTAFTPSVNGGLTNAVGDFDGDGWNDIILGSGSGGAPGVMVYKGGSSLFAPSTAAPTLLKVFAPVPSSFTGGVIATATPVNGGDPGTIERVYVTANLVGTSSFTRYVAPPNAGGPTPILPTIPGGANTTPRLVGYTTYAVGAGNGGSGTITEYAADGSVVNSFSPFPGATGGVRTAVADFNNDGIPDIVAGTGPGAVAQVKVFDGATGKLLFDVKPFEDFTGGVFVAAGDITGDNQADLVITPDLSGGPRVSIFRGGDFQMFANFFGIDDPNFRGGARAGVGDIDGDGYADLVVSAGFGGGPRLSIYDGKSLASGNTSVHMMPDFFLFEDTLRNGVYVAVGDVNGDGKADIIGGAGPGGGPRVLILNGNTLLNGGGIAAALNTPVANFFGGDETNRGGIRVAVKDLDGDEFADVVTGSGEGGGTHVAAYLGRDLKTGSAFDAANFDAFDNFTGGVFVG